MKQWYIHSIFLFLLCNTPLFAHKVAVIGTGYVGLVTGACLAHFGNTVICADIDTQKINNLNQGIIPIFEPGLEHLVLSEKAKSSLYFSDNPAQAIQQSDVLFIAVGTPTNSDGSADLRAVKSVLKTIAENINAPKIIVTKSTVPIGTGAWIEDTLINSYGLDSNMFSIVSNPEFLREGCAVQDFLTPDRLVIGADCPGAFATLQDIYATLLEQDIPIAHCNIPTAETIKYASNSFLATKISFINEMANLCDKTGADVAQVAHAMGLDKRISPYFLKPGPGFGGSCFPKDTFALVHTGEQFNVKINTVQGALNTNKEQLIIPFYKVQKLLHNDLAGKTIGILGLAFKAHTDDVRSSASLEVIKKLIEHGAHVKAYDPIAMSNASKEIPTVVYCQNTQEVCTDADAIIIMTEWPEFKQLDLHHIGTLMKQKVLVDARNILDYTMLNNAGFIWENIGSSYLCSN